MDLDYFKKIQGAYGFHTKKEAVLAKLRRHMERHFSDTIDCEDVLINGENRKLLVIHEKGNPYAKSIIALPGETLSRGWLVDCYSTKWLVTEADANSQVYPIGKMEQCNRELMWKNGAGEIVTRWCTAQKPYTANIDRGKIISVSSREYKIQMPYDEETALLDIGRRFLLDKIGQSAKSYAVTSVDSITNRYADASGGFLILNLTQDQFNPRYDSAEHMIANYYGYPYGAQEQPPYPPGAGCEIICGGLPEIKTGGTKKRFDAKFYDAAGDEMHKAPVWGFSCPEAARDEFVLTEDGGAFWIKAQSRPDLIGTICTLTLADAEGTCAAALDIKVVGSI